MSLAPDDPRHGTVNGYSNLDCRCQRCRDAWAADSKQKRSKRAERIALDPSVAVHGKPDTYLNWGCRCRPCTDAHSARRLRQIHRRASTVSH